MVTDFVPPSGGRRSSGRPRPSLPQLRESIHCHRPHGRNQVVRCFCFDDRLSSTRRVVDCCPPGSGVRQGGGSHTIWCQGEEGLGLCTESGAHIPAFFKAHLGAEQREGRKCTMGLGFFPRASSDSMCVLGRTMHVPKPKFLCPIQGLMLS